MAKKDTVTTALRWLSRMTFTAPWKSGLHSHNDWEMLLMLKGRLAIDVKGKMHSLGPAGIIAYPPHMPHHEWISGSDSVEVYSVAWAEEGSGPGGLFMTSDFDGHIADALRWMASLQHKNHPLSNPTISRLLQCILFELRTADARPQHAWLANVKKFIEENISERLTLQQLAKKACLSPSRFANNFHALTGQSPMAYVRTQRINEACRLLLSGNLRVAQAAWECGFTDPRHFCRVFRKIKGCAPSEIRIKS